MPKITDERKQEQRERILEAAIRVFAARGFRGASMAAIIKESGLSAGAIYTYFENRDALESEAANAILESRSSQLAEMAAERPVRSPVYAVRALAEGFPFEGADHSLHVQIWGESLSSPVLMEHSRTVMETLIQQMRGYLTAWLVHEREVPGPQAAERAEQLAPVVLGLAHGLVVQKAILDEAAEERYLAGVTQALTGL